MITEYPYTHVILHRHMYYNKFTEVEMLGLFKLPSNKIVLIYFLFQHFPYKILSREAKIVSHQKFNLQILKL